MPDASRAAGERRLGLPADSFAYRALSPVDYLDVYATEVAKQATLEEVAQPMLGGRPLRLMRLRDALVRPFGLKTTPRGPRRLSRFLKGERIGLFTVFERSAVELLVGEDDRHLDFRVCLRVTGDGQATLATLVRFNNGWGRAYFTLIRPFHGFVVKGMLRRAANALNGRVEVSP